MRAPRNKFLDLTSQLIFRQTTAQEVWPLRHAVLRSGLMLDTAKFDGGTLVRFMILIYSAACRFFTQHGATPMPGRYEEWQPHQLIRDRALVRFFFGMRSTWHMMKTLNGRSGVMLAQLLLVFMNRLIGQLRRTYLIFQRPAHT